VLAWIVTHDPKVVEDFAPDKEKSPAAKWDQIFADAAEQEFEAAFSKMIYKGEKGQLPATGCPLVDGNVYDRCPIEASHWGAGADLSDHRVLRTKEHANRFGGKVYPEDWVRVCFDPGSVLSQWPPAIEPLVEATAPAAVPRRAPGPHPAKTAAAAEALRKLLRTGEITKAQLLKNLKDGGLKYEDIAGRIGIVQSRCGRGNLPKWRAGLAHPVDPSGRSAHRLGRDRSTAEI
jgi:hypothetical protein